MTDTPEPESTNPENPAPEKLIPGGLGTLTVINLVLIIPIIALAPRTTPFAKEHLLSTITFIVLIIALLINAGTTLIITTLQKQHLIARLYAEYKHHGGTDNESDQPHE